MQIKITPVDADGNELEGNPGEVPDGCIGAVTEMPSGSFVAVPVTKETKSIRHRPRRGGPTVRAVRRRRRGGPEPRCQDSGPARRRPDRADRADRPCRGTGDDGPLAGAGRPVRGDVRVLRRPGACIPVAPVSRSPCSGGPKVLSISCPDLGRSTARTNSHRTPPIPTPP